MLLRELGHFRRCVVGIGLIVVRHDRHHPDPFCLQRAGVAGQPFGNGFHIGTMVADERDKKAFFAHGRIQRVFRSVGGFERKGPCFPSEVANGSIESHDFLLGVYPLIRRISASIGPRRNVRAHTKANRVAARQNNAAAANALEGACPPTIPSASSIPMPITMWLATLQKS